MNNSNQHIQNLPESGRHDTKKPWQKPTLTSLSVVEITRKPGMQVDGLLGTS